MNRNRRAQLGQQTVEIVQREWYQFAGERVDIAEQVASCLAGTVLFTPGELDKLVHAVEPAHHETHFDVRNETTLSASRRLVVDDGCSKTLSLNFASAKNPGGGFLGGSQAQEESLARSSALHASLLKQEDYYAANRRCGTALYTDHMILSPNVPVFRDDEGNLLPAPYLVSILTAPAVNAGAIRRNEPEQEPMIRPTMATRIAKVLAVAASRGCEDLVLGAWGCGVFRNNVSEIAELFADSLLRDERFANRFRSVTFAVLDQTDEGTIIGPFLEQFGAAGHP
jgi:uncharacterized protein (TIGR02452 family)